MATLVNNPKYGEGHKVILKDKLPSSQVKNTFIQFKYIPGKSTFSITKNPKSTATMTFGSGKATIFLKDEKNKIIRLLGNEGIINHIFNHFSGDKSGGKSDTTALTETKEIITMLLFESYIESKVILNEDKLINKLPSNIKKYYDSEYYDSSLKQLNLFKKIIGGSSGYTYERQKQTERTQKIYKLAGELTGKLPDNWNPGDIWLIKRNFKLDTILESRNANELNESIAKEYKKKNIIPISLKHIDKNSTGVVKVMDPGNLNSKNTEYNFNYDHTDLSESLNNFILSTKSKFQVRCGFKASATTLNVSLEGRLEGSGVQLGGIDAKGYREYVLHQYGYKLRGGEDISKIDYDTAKKELKEIFNKYPSYGSVKSYKQTIDIFENGNTLTQKRFCNLMSYMYSFIILPKTKFIQHINFCYYTAQKLSTDSCLYLIIK
jgi:hypothetical protein